MADNFSVRHLIRMIYVHRRKIKQLFLITVLFFILHVFGVFLHLFERDFDTDFHYPYDGDIEQLVSKLKRNDTPDVKPINSYNFEYSKSCRHKCEDIVNIRLVYLVKSAPSNINKRIAIRSSWGFEKRFSDVEIRTVFLIGTTESNTIQGFINSEHERFNDIVQGNFTDSYYNNTYKTMMGLSWCIKFCPNSRFYMFTDDDYYVSTKNVLRFLRYPTNYPQYLKEPLANIKTLFNKRKSLQILDFDLEDDVRLYSGYTYKSAPLRHYPCKWYVSLAEYPYDKWPPYVTGGAYVLSREALHDMYYASFYTKHFRFDDIYLGLLAYKLKIEPFHCEEFHFHRESFTIKDFEYIIASHGFDDPDELIKTWTYQKSMGNA